MSAAFVGDQMEQITGRSLELERGFETLLIKGHYPSPKRSPI